MVSGVCSDDVLKNSELYDPVNESWTISNMNAARHLHQLRPTEIRRYENNHENYPSLSKR